MNSFLVCCLIVFVMLSIMWSHSDGLNLLIKAIFVAMAVWSALYLFAGKLS